MMSGGDGGNDRRGRGMMVMEMVVILEGMIMVVILEGMVMVVVVEGWL